MRALVRILKIAFYFSIFSAANANASVVYTYTGSHFTDFAWDSYHVHPLQVFDSSDNVTFQFTLSGALPPLMSLWYSAGYPFGTYVTETIVNQDTSIPPPVVVESWSLTSGPLNYSGTALQDIDFIVYTDIDGNVFDWRFTTRQYSNFFLPNSPYPEIDSYIYSTGNYYFGPFSEMAITCLGDIDCLADPGYPIGLTATPGVWTISSVNPPSQIPTPSSAALSILAISCLLYSRKKSGAFRNEMQPNRVAFSQ